MSAVFCWLPVWKELSSRAYVLISHNHGVAMRDVIKDSEIFLMDGSGHQGIFCERKVWDKVRSFLFERLDIPSKWHAYKTTARAKFEEEVQHYDTFLPSLYETDTTVSLPNVKEKSF
ncbi:hypothetical protein WR25_08588 [Diploscapter pachys]|uniref:Uncharacterized protein n=1 Tax=Diploscapter pachys TaxID=2018661 RepID=A0A2A2JLS5_9BILA|nr:hypothetical protein WR25_08588 [Diploscapter pachys]